MTLLSYSKNENFKPPTNLNFVFSGIYLKHLFILVHKYFIFICWFGFFVCFLQVKCVYILQHKLRVTYLGFFFFR